MSVGIIGFNSKLVRLKVKGSDAPQPPIARFNSKLVRLKDGGFGESTNAGTGFQFQTGAIKSL